MKMSQETLKTLLDQFKDIIKTFSHSVLVDYLFLLKLSENYKVCDLTSSILLLKSKEYASLWKNRNCMFG